MRDNLSEKTLRMARHSAAEIFGGNIEESLTLCEQEDLEYSLKEILNGSVGKVLHHLNR